MDELSRNNIERSLEVQKQHFEKSKANFLKKDVKILLKDMIKKKEEQAMCKEKVSEQWLALLFLYRMMGSLYRMFDAKLRAHKKQIKILTRVMSFTRKAQNSTYSKGSDIDERLILDIRK